MCARSEIKLYNIRIIKLIVKWFLRQAKVMVFDVIYRTDYEGNEDKEIDR